MGLRRLPAIIIVGSALAIAATTASASPPDGPPMPPPDQGPGMMHHGSGMIHQEQGYTPPPQFRDSWIAECTDRLADGYGRRKARHAEERCVRYFDSYYDYYRMHQPAPGYAYGYQGAAMGYGTCCQQPMMMMPAPRMARREPECTETVEYEYVDVPVRRRPPPPAPTKRVKVVPDKRIKLK